MLILFSGPIGAGKTTFCQQLAAAARARGVPVAGVLAPAIAQDGQKVGIEAVDLRSGARRTLARTDRDLGGVRVGPYSFDDQALTWALQRCQEALRGDALAFVDEIGRLELERGEGLAPLLPLLARPRPAHTVVIVRDTLLDELAARVAAAQPRVVTLQDTKMQELLFEVYRCRTRQKNRTRIPTDETD